MNRDSERTENRSSSLRCRTALPLQAEHFPRLATGKVQYRDVSVDLTGTWISINRGWGYGEVLAKHTQQVHVLDRFNQGLVKMKATGTYSRIIGTFIHGAKAD